MIRIKIKSAKCLVLASLSSCWTLILLSQGTSKIPIQWDQPFSEKQKGQDGFDDFTLHGLSQNECSPWFLAGENHHG